MEECATCGGLGVYEDPDAWNITARELTNCPVCNPKGDKKPKKLPSGNGLAT